MVISSTTQTLDRGSSMVRGWLYGLVKSFPFCTMVYGWWKTGRMRTCLFNARLRGWFLRQDLRVYRCVLCRKVAMLRVRWNNVTGKGKSCGRWKNNIYFVIGHSCDSLIIMCYVL